MIKYLDLNKVNAKYKSEFQAQFEKFLDSGNYILGKEVENFEKEFAEYCGIKHCIGVGNGLDALTLILKGYINLGQLKLGDSVLVPANTFIATILSVIHAGLKPVLVEPEITTFNITLKAIENSFTSDIKSIIVVHLYGQLVQDVEAIGTFCQEQKLLLIEDAAQAHGAFNYNNIKAGAFGRAAAFSFYPTKNLGALADAGAIATNDDELTHQVRLMRNYGSRVKYKFDEIGYNSRLDEIQASFLRIKLKDLDAGNRKRQDIASRYVNEIHNKRIKLPYFSESSDHVFYAFVIRVDNREKFLSYISDHKIEVNVHYPIPPFEQTALRKAGNTHFPITQTIHDTVVSLPLNPTLSNNEINKIISALNLY